MTERASDLLSELAEKLSGSASDTGLVAAESVRARNPDAVFCCDPVLGDVGRGLYVREGVAEFMRERALPAAAILTPNHFELDLLSGSASTNIAGARQASPRASPPVTHPEASRLIAPTRAATAALITPASLDEPIFAAEARPPSSFPAPGDKRSAQRPGARWRRSDTGPSASAKGFLTSVGAGRSPTRFER